MAKAQAPPFALLHNSATASPQNQANYIAEKFAVVYDELKRRGIVGEFAGFGTGVGT